MTKLMLVLLLSCAPGASMMAAQKPPVNPDAAVLQEFQKSVNGYMKLHKKFEKESPLKETNDPSKIRAAQASLAQDIRAARPNARPGEIFTPAVQKQFRKLLRPEVTGPDATETKQAIKEDGPKAVPVKVNASYPSDQPLPTVPPNILRRLPKLPEDLEYRIIGKTLILRDVHANIIVDFMPNAIT